MSRFIYTVEEHGPNGKKVQTFEGFRRYTGGQVACLACVLVTGELDVYEIDGDKVRAVEELQRMYRMLYDVDQASVYLFKSL